MKKLLFAGILSVIFALAGNAPVAAAQKLDVARFNRIYHAVVVEQEMPLDVLSPATWSVHSAGVCAKKHIKALVFGFVVFVIFLFTLIPRMIRPELQGLLPLDVFKKLKGFSPGRWEQTEITALANACCKLNRLSIPLVAKLDSQQSEDFLNALYGSASYGLFAEALFLRRDIFDRIPKNGEVRVAYGECGLSCIKRLPVSVLAKAVSPDGTLAFQTANSLAYVFINSGQTEKALELLQTVPPFKMHKSTWELLLDICGSVHTLPAAYLEATPRLLLSRTVMALIDEGHSPVARRLLERYPRETWQMDDHLAYFALQLETDLAMANEFYAVFLRTVDLRRHPEMHYAAAQRCEKKGHTDMAIAIYRRFISEGITYHDVVARYESLHKNLAVESRNYTIMFTDIQNYTQRCSSEPAAFMMEYLKKHNSIIAPQILAFKGKVVKTIGDAFLAVFSSSTNAVLCGIAVQKALAEYNTGKSERDIIRVRVALHTGEVSVAADGDIYGEAVNLAARVEGVTKPDEIWFTETVFMTMNSNDIKYSQVGYENFKGIAKPVMLYRIAPNQRSRE